MNTSRFAIRWLHSPRHLIIPLLALALTHASSAAGQATQPRVFILDAALLAESKSQLASEDPAVLAAVHGLEKQAAKALKAGPYSVTTKTFTPPSGDKHDYMSLSIYWWPNPVTKYPYIHRDGHRNPEADEYDGAKIAPMARNVHTLALAYFFTGDETYATHAALLLRTWFLDESTRMNPNMDFAQGIPGLCSGARQGVIETVPLATQVVDAVGLLAPSPSWTQQDQEALQAWFEDYLRWLQTDRLGKKEAKRNNNHGVWYDVQVTAYALLTGHENLARRILDDRTKRRIVSQIKPDGRQPAELGRTKSFDYSCYNLDALFNAAFLADSAGVDLWDFEGERGQGIRKALVFLLDYVGKADTWPHEQIYDINPANRLYPFVYKAAVRFGDEACRQALDSTSEFQTRESGGVLLLTYPQ